ncbi:MAG: hypothetical protein ACRDKJ_08775 [Actinomycetota bacterium]
MSVDRRSILEQVARGELSPEEADRLLGGDEPAAEAPPAPPEPDSPIQKIKVTAGFGAIVVIGDPDVAEADVEGAHSASIDGDTLVIRGDVEAVTPGAFAIHLGPRRHRVGGVRIGSKHASSLRVRMNPALALEAKIDAGPLSITGIAAPIRARAAAGPITIEEFDGPLDVSVNAGAVRAIGKITGGESRIRSDAGAVRVELDPSSSVRIFADAALGKVILPGAEEPERRRFGSRREATIGTGEGVLRVETAMGSINVTVG